MKLLFKKGSLTCLLGCCCTFWALGQETISLSLEEALSKAKTESWEMKLKSAESQAAQAEYRQTNALFLPQVEFSQTGIRTNNPLHVFGIRLLQENVEQADFNPASLNDPANINNFTTQLEVRQPIFNLDAYHGRKAAEAKVKASQLATERTGQFLELEVKKAYFSLQLAYKSKKVVTKALEAANANLKLTTDNLAQGYVKPADVMAVELRILEIEKQLAEVQTHIQNASDYLGYFLQLGPTTLITPTDDLSAKAVSPSTETNVPESRADLQALQFAKEARQRILQHHKSKLLPRLNAFGSYQFNDTTPFGTQGENFLIGAQLSWTLFNGGQNYAGIKKAQAEFTQADLQFQQSVSQADMELRKAQREWLLAQQQVEISKKAVAQAQEAERILKNRYAQGMERTADVLTASAKTASTELEKLQAWYKLQTAQFQIDYLLGN